MNLKQTSDWQNFTQIESNSLITKNVRSWLLEEGPITKRIKSNGKFRLSLIKDEYSKITAWEKKFLGILNERTKAREVILYSNEKPFVYARSIIPELTIQKGLDKLGNLGLKPLGDILFENKFFTKDKTFFASFSDQEKAYIGRTTKYLVKNFPLSVMEIFLI